MPPKKKKDDGKKKEKKISKKSFGGPQAQDQLNDQSREYYLTQIKDLENRIDRYQRKCDQLEVSNGEYREKFEQLEENKKDIVAFIKKKLDEKVDEISDLNNRLISLQDTKDKDREMFEQQLQQLTNEFRETKEQLSSDNTMLSGKLASLEEFRVQRQELISQTTQLEAMLQEQEKLHQQQIYDLEKKQVIDKDRLKKEMIARVNQVAAEFRKASSRHIADTTKRTIRENVAICTQLTKISDKTVELIANNDSLKEHERRLRQEIELLQVSETMLTEKNIANQKMIQMLLEKCRAQELSLEEGDSVTDHCQQVEAELMQLHKDLDLARNQMTLLARKNEEFQQELDATKKSLKDQARTRRQLEKVLQDAAFAVQSMLTPISDEDCADSLHSAIGKRKSLLENLLVLLNSATDLGVGPSIAELGSRPEEVVSVRGLEHEDRLPHYKPGDLGLVPRHEQCLSAGSATRHVTTDRRATTKKVPCQSVATQTVSAVKAMFFVDQPVGRLSAKQPLSSRRSTHNAQTLPSIITPRVC